jgi:hypothetical protein
VIAIPPEAIDAAERSAAAYPNGHRQSSRDMVRAALEAAAPLIAAAERARITELETQLAHARLALAADHEGIRLWMLDCAELAEKHRKRADAAWDAARRDERARIIQLAVMTAENFGDDPGMAALRKFADLLDGAP